MSLRTSPLPLLLVPTIQATYLLLKFATQSLFQYPWRMTSWKTTIVALNISLFYHLSTNDQVVCPACSLKLSSINQIVTSFNLRFHLQPHLSSLPSLCGRSQTFCTSLGKLSRYPLSIKQMKTDAALTNRNEPRVVASTPDRWLASFPDICQAL